MRRTYGNVLGSRGVCVTLVAGMTLFGVGCDGLNGTSMVSPVDDAPTTDEDDTSSADNDDSAAALSFSDDLIPLFARRCTICHVDGGFADQQGIDLRLAEDDTYDQLVDQVSIQRSDLTLVVPGDSQASLLFLKVSSDSPPVGNRMPLGGSLLADDEIAIIRDWIDQGALDN